MIDFDAQPYAVDNVTVRDVHDHNATSHTIAGEAE